MEEIGMFRGQFISKMSRDELLDFATWAGKRIEELENIEKETQNFRLAKEIDDFVRH